jgi:murein DD-endopeptidase MepM/ murein hydrolase activator NlpD
MNHKTILYTILALILSSSVFLFGYKKPYDPQEVYRVYLDGESIGLIYSKKDLEDYINKEEEYVKKQYDVSKVYIPNNLDIVKEITYNEKVESTVAIYEKIKDKAPFTIKGYKITVKGVEEITDKGSAKTDDVIINVLDKQIFIDAVENTIGAFIDKESYQRFLKGTQEEIKDTGTIIEDVYIQNDLIIKEANISIKDQIFLNSESLSKYLLFGTLEEQQKYTVKLGDTIESVSYNNKLSVGEFLIANEQFNSADNLLYEGQEVTLGIIKPAFKVVEESHAVTEEEVRYETIYEDDESLIIGTEYVKQEGSNGLIRATRKMKTVNGDVIEAVPVEEVNIIPVVNKIVVRGKKYVPNVGTGNWYWPTATPYMISSPYGWRWGKMHKGLDITGTGRGSPIYAADNGVVTKASYNGTNGYYIYIDHNNGYLSEYAHMDSLKVKEGQVVEAGQIIGTMGDTGFSTGVHLHFGIWWGNPANGTAFNPLNFYR